MPLCINPLSLAVVVRERVWIPKPLFVSGFGKLAADLTVPNGAAQGARRRGFKVNENVPEEFVLYEETEGHVIVPRAYDWRAAVSGVEGRHWQLVDLTGRRGAIVGHDDIVLGPHVQQPFDQGPAFAALSAPDTLPHGRILVLRCGAGKTAIALKAAHARGGRTLWVTITNPLLDQARRDISRYLSLDLCRIGWIQSSRADWRGFGIATTMLQTLAQRDDLPPAFWDYWDTVIFDEGDVLGAPSFHAVVPKFRAERWLLTATPNRPDGNDALFRLHIGPVCYEHSQFDLKPECHFISTSAPETHVALFGWDSVHRKKRVQYAVTARNLLCDEERQQLITERVKQAVAAGRTVLVVGDSVDGMALLRKHAEAVLRVPCSIVTGETKRSERTAAIQTPQVVFATSKLFQRGLDRVAFDTLVLASLTTVNDTFCHQISGRILRANAARPDKRPIIVVAADVKINELRFMAAELANRFKGYGWAVAGCADQLLAERAARRRRH